MFAVQDDITEQVVAAVEPHLYAEEGYRAASKQPDSIDAWGLVARALSLTSKVDREGNVEAQKLLRRAIEMDPATRAPTRCSVGRSGGRLLFLASGPAEGYRQAATHAEQALSLDAPTHGRG